MRAIIYYRDEAQAIFKHDLGTSGTVSEGAEQGCRTSTHSVGKRGLVDLWPISN